MTLIGLSALTTTVVHLLLRDRRRGELVALALHPGPADDEPDAVRFSAPRSGESGGERRRRERKAPEREPARAPWLVVCEAARICGLPIGALRAAFAPPSTGAGAGTPASGPC